MAMASTDSGKLVADRAVMHTLLAASACATHHSCQLHCAKAHEMNVLGMHVLIDMHAGKAMVQALKAAT